MKPYICCDEVQQAYDEGWLNQMGSHYHCGNCGEKAGMYGHYHSIHIVNGKAVKVDSHFSCSNECNPNT